MDMARVIGHIVASQKDPSMECVKISVIQPLDEKMNPSGFPLIATDSLSRWDTGDIVFFVASGDAVFTGPGGRAMPVDAAIMGNVDKVWVDDNVIQSAK